MKWAQTENRQKGQREVRCESCRGRKDGFRDRQGSVEIKSRAWRAGLPELGPESASSSVNSGRS